MGQINKTLYDRREVAELVCEHVAEVIDKLRIQANPPPIIISCDVWHAKERVEQLEKWAQKAIAALVTAKSAIWSQSDISGTDAEIHNLCNEVASEGDRILRRQHESKRT